MSKITRTPHMKLGKKPKSQIKKELSKAPRPNVRLNLKGRSRPTSKIVETIRPKDSLLYQWRKHEEYDDFFNRLLTALNKPKSAFVDVRPDLFDKRAKYVINSTRKELLNAKRFMVKDSLLAEAVSLSFAKPTTFLNAVEIGRPPFENMWIEWDEQVRLDHIRPFLEKEREKGLNIDLENFDADTVGTKRVGYHIYASSDGSYTYDQYHHWENPNKILGKRNYIGFPCVSVSLNNATEHNSARGGYWDAMKMFLGSPYNRPQDNPIEEHAKKRVINRMNLRSHNLWPLPVEGGSKIKMLEIFHSWRTSKDDISARDRGLGKDLLYREVSKSAGDIRTLASILCLLNYNHNIIERKQNTISKVARTAWGSVVPRNELRVLEIELPKPRGTTQYERMFTGHGSPKRQHTRMGHWRIKRNPNGSIKWKRWISEMTCGNPELGIIEKEHHLKGRMA